MASLRCTVRGCARDLSPPAASSAGTLGCAAGHRFDRARNGYVNLLQPQDRRSRRPGDAPAAVAARGRSMARGLAAALASEVAAHIVAHLAADSAPPLRAALLDVGTGDGSLLAAVLSGVSTRQPLDVHAVDLSVAAIEAATRHLPGATLVVANADRALPWADGGFDVVLSLNARLHAAEMRRVLKPTGLLLVAVPAADDLAELRAAVLGRADTRQRMARALAVLAGEFDTTRTQEIRRVVSLEPAALADLLTATYRGQRRATAERVAELTRMDVTTCWELSLLQPRG